MVDCEGFRFEDDNSVACEQQKYFRASLLPLRKIEGGREATTGNTSAVRRLTTQWLYLIYFNRWFLGVVDGYSHQMTEYKRLKIH